MMIIISYGKIQYLQNRQIRRHFVAHKWPACKKFCSKQVADLNVLECIGQLAAHCQLQASICCKQTCDLRNRMMPLSAVLQVKLDFKLSSSSHTLSNQCPLFLLYFSLYGRYLLPLQALPASSSTLVASASSYYTCNHPNNCTPAICSICFDFCTQLLLAGIQQLQATKGLLINIILI